MDKPYILSQIKKAIEIAKKHGSAIAIGHPHANTIAAISESKTFFRRRFSFCEQTLKHEQDRV